MTTCRRRLIVLVLLPLIASLTVGLLLYRHLSHVDYVLDDDLTIAILDASSHDGRIFLVYQLERVNKGQKPIRLLRYPAQKFAITFFDEKGSLLNEELIWSDLDSDFRALIVSRHVGVLSCRVHDSAQSYSLRVGETELPARFPLHGLCKRFLTTLHQFRL